MDANSHGLGSNDMVWIIGLCVVADIQRYVHEFIYEMV